VNKSTGGKSGRQSILPQPNPLPVKRIVDVIKENRWRGGGLFQRDLRAITFAFGCRRDRIHSIESAVRNGNLATRGRVN
jgi:hypothetical protein